MAVRRDGNQFGSRKKKPASRGGHPSRGGTTVGGGTKGRKPTRYKSPTPKPRPPAPKPDVTLGGDVTPTRSGHKKSARRPAAPYSMLDVKKGKKFKPNRSVSKKKLDRSVRALHRLQAADRKKKEDTDTKINLGPLGKLNVEAELEGRGGLAKAGRFVGDKLSSQAGKTLRTQGIGLPPSLDKYVGRAVRDATDLPAQTIASTYAVAAGAKEAAQGRPQRIKELGKQLKEHDPVVLAAQGEFKKAAKEASKHPLVAGLEVTGLGKGLSRVPNRIVKPKPKVRSVPGANIKVIERREEGVVGRAVRKKVHGKRLKKARKHYAEAERLRKSGAPVHEIREAENRGLQLDPRRVQEHEIRHRTDRREGLAEPRRRKHRAEVTKKVDKALEKEPAGQLLVAQRITGASDESIRSYLAQVKREGKDLKGAKKSANLRLQRSLREALKEKQPEKFTAQGQKYTDVVKPLQKELARRKIVEPKAEQMAKLVPYARQEMGAKWRPAERTTRKLDAGPPPGGGWKKTGVKGNTAYYSREARLELDGRSLKVREIEAHMRQKGINPDNVAFVSHSPSARGAKDYFRNWKVRQDVPSTRRTGAAVVEGTHDLSRESARGNAVGMQSLIDAHNEYAGMVKENGLRSPGGKVRAFKDAKTARQFLRDLQEQPAEAGGKLTPAAHNWRVMPLNPPFGRKGGGDMILDQANADVPFADAVDLALKGEGDGKFVLVLDSAAEQMAAHTRALGTSPGGAAFRVGSRMFKSAVLATNPKWAAGNVIEAAVRSAVRGAGPVDYKLGKAVIARAKRIDPKLAEELELGIGEGHFGMVELQAVYTAADKFAGTKLWKLARIAGAARRTPGPKQIADLWMAFTHQVFSKTGQLEAQFKVAMVGEYANKFLMDGKTLRTWDRAVEQAARGLLDTNEQVAAIDWVTRAYGQYESFSPSMRAAIAQYTPFLPWTINAVKFLGSVMPRDHPVQTALAGMAYNATEEWRHSQGQGKGIKGAPPGWLQGAIPDGNQWRNLQRYTPFGVASDPVETAGGAILPQISGVVMASKGLDWTGKPLNDHRRPDDVPGEERVSAALSSLFDAMVPIVGQARRAAKKEGSVPSKIAQTVNPYQGVPRQDPRISRAFDELEQIQAKKDELNDGKLHGEKISASNPTPEYVRLHVRDRRLNEQLYRLSKGAYGHHYKEPYEHGGSAGGSSSGSGWDQYREGAAPKQKSGWDAYR